MSIRTAPGNNMFARGLAKIFAGKEVIPATKTETITALNESGTLGKMSAEELRSLLLQLVPSPLSGRPGPVQIMTPFETEQEVRSEMRRLQKELTESHQRVFDLSERLAVFESSEKGQMVKELERLRPRVTALEIPIKELLFVIDGVYTPDPLINGDLLRSALAKAVQKANEALGTANAQSKSE